MRQRILGGLTAGEFLRTYWQKRPLLVRGALPGFRGVIGERALARLAAREGVDARLVRRSGARWRVEHGPIAPARLARAGRANWTLLVNGVNLYDAAADRLLRRFDFVPQARLDDVMVSYAVPGGGVGPHYDSYDVFLLQGAGRRVWRLCAPRRFALVADAPVRLIEDFVAEDELLVEPGDLLYLPPGWGHDGIALEPCFTVSVGFRAPAGAELASAFLDWLHERGLPEAQYRDPGLRPAARPAQIPAAMCAYARAIVERLRWSRADIVGFLGEQLTAPKPGVVFDRPRRALPRRAFARRLERGDAALDAKTQLLYRGTRFFVNGEVLAPAPARASRRALAALADARRIPGRALVRAGLAGLAHEWYRCGYLRLERAP
jgi:50S ribosomal protein L16 3-hydroxylase